MARFGTGKPNEVNTNMASKLGAGLGTQNPESPDMM